MDSRFAIFFLIMGGTDTYLNDCQTECFQQNEAPERLSIQYGDTYFQENIIGDEWYISYDAPVRYGAFQPTAGASITSDDDMWFGAGGKWSTENTVGGPIYIELSLMPGVYLRGDGPNIGYPIQFRGALGAGYHFDNGASLSMFYDHRSNAELSEVNSGIETVGVRLSYQLN
jgi:hypothetical protein